MLCLFLSRGLWKPRVRFSRVSHTNIPTTHMPMEETFNTARYKYLRTVDSDRMRDLVVAHAGISWLDVLLMTNGPRAVIEYLGL